MSDQIKRKDGDKDGCDASESDGNSSSKVEDKEDDDHRHDSSNPFGSSYMYSHLYQYDPTALGELLENVSGALSNLAFRNQTNQDEMRRNGTLSLCLSALCGRVGIEREFVGLNSVSKLLEQRRSQAQRNYRERRERRERRRERRNQGVYSTGGSSYSSESGTGGGGSGGSEVEDNIPIESDNPTLGVTHYARLPCRPLTLTTSILNIIVNAVDANPLNQVALGTPSVAKLLTLLMGHGGNGKTSDDHLPLFDEDMNGREQAVWCAHVTPLSLVVGMQKVSAMACLLASHMAWDNIVNQMHFGTLERVAQLLYLVETGSQFGHLLRTTVKGQVVLKNMPLINSNNRGMDVQETKKMNGDGSDLPASSSSSSSQSVGHGSTNPSDGIVSSSTNVETNTAANSTTADLLAEEDPKGREGINYLQDSGDGMMNSHQTSLGIFSVDEMNVGSGGSEEEVQLYALMALINMSYHNVAVHNLVHQAGGVQTILHLLGSDAFDVRKAAIFCLGNVVTGHKVSHVFYHRFVNVYVFLSFLLTIKFNFYYSSIFVR